jgi:hypothetical protein
MNVLNVSILLIAFLSLSGCSLWPDKGRGGFAEYQQEMIYPVMPDQPLGIEHGQRLYRLNNAWLGSVVKCMVDLNMTRQMI